MSGCCVCVCGVFKNVAGCHLLLFAARSHSFIRSLRVLQADIFVSCLTIVGVVVAFGIVVVVVVAANFCFRSL